MSVCLRCNGNRTVWEKNEFGYFVSSSCPTCNKNGEAIKESQAEMDQLYEQIRRETADSEKRAVNE